MRTVNFRQPLSDAGQLNIEPALFFMLRPL
jgi:hypothetical protein